jgi:O-antigen ligase
MGSARPRRIAAIKEPRLIIFLCFLLLCACGGGIARVDAFPLIYIRPAAVLTIGALFVAPGTWDWRGLRIPAAFLAAFTLTILIQLVPLPPTIWAALPARAPYLAAADIAGIPQPWRPISLIPVRTLNSIFAMLPAFTTVVAMAGISRRNWWVIGDLCLVLCCVSSLLGIVQFATGTLYFSTPSDQGMPIGLFANRNHQALFLVIGILLLAHWGMRERRIGDHLARQGIALGGTLIFVIVILLTGSRTGLMLLLGALAMTAATMALRKQQTRLPTFLVILAPFAMVAIGAYFAQESSIVRLDQSVGKLDQDMRILALPTVWEIMVRYLPWGTGFGTFDRLFMQFEPDAMLTQRFFNRAHNDPLEVLITGGIPSAMIILLFLLWLLVMGGSVLKKCGLSMDKIQTLAIVSTLFIMLGSIVDYPLRTPLIATIFCIMVCFATAYRGNAKNA